MSDCVIRSARPGDEPELSLILEDEQGICGYALGALDSRAFYARCDAEWRPDLCARFTAPQGDPSRWSRLQHVHDCYHHPDYFCPEPYDAYPSHLHIDLLPRAQGRGYGRRMLEQIMDTLRRRGSPGAHLGVSTLNTHAFGFYQRLGFRELIRVGSDRGDLRNPAHPMNPLNPLNLVNPLNPVNLVNEDRCIYMGRELGVRSS